jgi:hypothetical protein
MLDVVLNTFDMLFRDRKDRKQGFGIGDRVPLIQPLL